MFLANKVGFLRKHWFLTKGRCLTFYTINMFIKFAKFSKSIKNIYGIKVKSNKIIFILRILFKNLMEKEERSLKKMVS